MTQEEENFLKAYYKAAETSQPNDWLQAALMAKQMYNTGRDPKEYILEKKIADEAIALYHPKHFA